MEDVNFQLKSECWGSAERTPRFFPRARTQMKREERVSYVMLFCALMLVRNYKTTLEESVGIVPLVGGAEHLARELVNGLADY